MNKYKAIDFFSNEGSAYQRTIPILTAIANELAEANRLKRLELQLDPADYYQNITDQAISEKQSLEEVK